MRRITTAAFLTVLTATAADVSAEIPTYELELQARAALTASPIGAFNLPVGAWLTNEAVVVNLDRQVTFALSTEQAGTEGVWRGGGGNGQIIWYAPNGSLVSHPSMNDSGTIVFDVGFSDSDGIYSIAAGAMDPMLVTTGPGAADDWGAAKITNAGDIGFQAIRSGNRSYALWNGSAATSIVTQGPDYDYLFTPQTTEGPLIAAKITPGGGGPNEIRTFDANGFVDTIAVADGNPYTDFDNGVDVANNGLVAFIGRRDGGRDIVVSDGNTTNVYASEGMTPVAEIDFFRPTVNGSGLVAFRGYDDTDSHAIFVADGTETRILVKEGDAVPTDSGDGQLGQQDATAPVFSAEPIVNERGDVAFAAGLTAPNDTQVDWGVGVYVALSSLEAPEPADMGSSTSDAGGSAGPDMGTSSGSDGGSLPSNNTANNNSPTNNVAGGPDGGSTPGPGGSQTTTGEAAGSDEGCCATTGGSRSSSIALLVGLLLLAVRRRMA